MKKGKSFLSVLLALLMLFNLTVLTSAEEKPELKITANVTEITQGTGTADIVYTVKVDPKGNQIAAFSFKLVAPEGMTLAQDEVDDEGADGYWLNSDLIYNKKYTPNGPFTTFEYVPTTGYFGASGGIEGRKLASEETIMTIKATVDISVARVYTFGDVDFICGSDGDTTFVNPTTSIASVTIKGAHTHVFDQKNTDAKYLASAASCTAKATYYYSCTCGEKGTATFESGETLPHTASTVWSKDETNHWHVCTVCNVEMDKAAHTPDHEGGATETYPIKCTECGYVIEAQLDHTHSFTQEVAEAKYLKSAAGCDAPAVYYKSCTCGEASTTETFQYGTALGHSYTAEKVADQYLKDAAGCETDAVYFKSCARCGAKGTETFTVANSALGHKGGAWQSDETGHWKVCERVNCGKRFNEGTHDGGKATCQAKAACTTCGAAYGELGAHDMDTKWSSNDTQHFHKCLTKGCDYIKDAADHSGGKATCKEKAKCDVCAAEYGNLGAHTLTKTAAKAPTCLEPGNNEYYTCSVCGKVFKDAAGTTETTVAAETLAKSTTHVVESKYVTNATEHFKTCSVCGIEIKDSRAKHTFVKDEATGVETCSVCGYAIGGKVDENHKHAADKEAGLFRDENNHWYKCTDKNCTSHVGEAKHDFETVSTTKDGNKTTTVEKCKTCGYVKTTTVDNTPTTPTKPGRRPSGTKTVQSGKTFDAGVGVYVGLSILSLTGSAVVIGKKRKTR